MIKCTLFGAIIAVVCSYKGMTASGGAAGVGRAVNEAVVISFMAVFAFNYVFTQTLEAQLPELLLIPFLGWSEARRVAIGGCDR